MAQYSFTPRGGSAYFGGGGGWLTGLGSAFGGGMSAGIAQTNALREMQDANAISPYAVSAAQSQLGASRILGLGEQVRGQLTNDGLAELMRTRANEQAGTSQPNTTAALAPPVAPDLASVASTFGQQAVAGGVQTDPLMSSGAMDANRMLMLQQYGYNQPLYNPSGMNYWGF